MSSKPNLGLLKEITKMARDPALRQMVSAAKNMRTLVEAVRSTLPDLQDAERASRLNDLALGMMKSPISAAIGAIQAEIDKEGPLTGRQVLFLIMEKKGIKVSDALRQLAEIGERVVDGGKKGHSVTHGTEEQKSDKHSQWQKLVNEACEKHPAKSFTAIKNLVAKDKANGVSVHQLKRYTKDPRK